MMENLGFLRRDERGTSIIEMGLVAPLLAAFLIGMVDIARATAAKLQTAQIAQRSMERLVAQPNVTDATLITEAAEAAEVEETAVIIDRWLECNGDEETVASACPAGETYARYVSISVAKAYEPYLSSRFAMTVTGKAGIRIQ